MRPPRLLISDDDELVMRTLATLARSEGLEVFEDLEQRVVVLTEQLRPDLVLLDIHQPNTDGRNLLLRLKDNEDTADTEVVVMSGNYEAHTRTECLLLGALEFVSKPIDLDTLQTIARLTRAAASKRMQEEEDVRPRFIAYRMPRAGT